MLFNWKYKYVRETERNLSLVVVSVVLTYTNSDGTAPVQNKSQKLIDYVLDRF